MIMGEPGYVYTSKENTDHIQMTAEGKMWKFMCIT